jgi:hypothetical protein
MASNFKIAAMFIFFLQMCIVMVTYIAIVPGTYLDTTLTSRAWYAEQSTSVTDAQARGVYDPSNANNNPTSTFNLFGMGWVFQVITLVADIFRNCTYNAPAFYTALFGIVDKNIAEAALFGNIIGGMQCFAFLIGLASIVMRWNI